MPQILICSHSTPGHLIPCSPPAKIADSLEGVSLVLLSGSDKSAVALSQDRISQVRGRHRDRWTWGQRIQQSLCEATATASWVTNSGSASYSAVLNYLLSGISLETSPIAPVLVCPSLLSVTPVNTRIKSNLGRKGYFS